MSLGRVAGPGKTKLASSQSRTGPYPKLHTANPVGSEPWCTRKNSWAGFANDLISLLFCYYYRRKTLADCIVFEGLGKWNSGTAWLGNDIKDVALPLQRWFFFSLMAVDSLGLGMSEMQDNYFSFCYYSAFFGNVLSRRHILRARNVNLSLAPFWIADDMQAFVLNNLRINSTTPSFLCFCFPLPLQQT